MLAADPLRDASLSTGGYADCEVRRDGSGIEADRSSALRDCTDRSKIPSVSGAAEAAGAVEGNKGSKSESIDASLEDARFVE